MTHEERFKTSRNYRREDTGVRAGSFSVGAGDFAFIAGPCSVENYETTLAIATEVKKAGAGMLRGGAFKPRTSPFSFQGLGKEGIEILTRVSREVNLPTVSEITDPRQLEMFEKIDMLQVGSRNMQNFELLRELGHTEKPILLKRGMSATVEELLLSAEYIMAGGNENIVLCERGIRTFGSDLRNTFDAGAIALLKKETHLPVIADPSHAAGSAALVPPLALAAAAAGADGIMIEVHIDPESSVSDPLQALTPSRFREIVDSVNALRKAIT